MELVWNSEFHINEKASEIMVSMTGIPDHSRTLCLTPMGTVGQDVPSIMILTLHLLWRELII